jgi:hypothetical protein
MKLGVSGGVRGAVTALGLFVFFLGIESLARRIASMRVFQKSRQGREE